MGKRFTAGYGIYASPGFYGSDGLTPINLTHEGFLEFATGKKFSLGLSARFYNAVTNNTRETTVSAYDSYNGNYLQQTDKPEGVTQLKGKNFMLYGKFFKDRYVAPWGKYFMLGATLNTFSASYDPDQMYMVVRNSNYYSNQSYIYYNNFGPVKQNFIKFDVMLGNGRSRIIANRVVIDYGYTVNVWAATSLLLDLVKSEDAVTSDDYIKEIASARAKGVNRFNIFLKVGVLLF